MIKNYEEILAKCRNILKDDPNNAAAPEFFSGCYF